MAHKDVAKYPKSWDLVGKGLVCVPPNRGPCSGERGEGSEWERRFGCRCGKRFDLNFCCDRRGHVQALPACAHFS